MSLQYDQYLISHRANVQRGYEWLVENLPEIIPHDSRLGWLTGYAHDKSKDDPEEYDAYDAYFYRGNRSYRIVQDFNRAWLRHIHQNPHHWQYWVLINDDPAEGEVLIEMPTDYAIEMICDWWAFSWSKGDLFEIFSWYEQRKDYIKLHPRTRTFVEDVLNQIKSKLKQSSTTPRPD